MLTQGGGDSRQTDPNLSGVTDRSALGIDGKTGRCYKTSTVYVHGA